MSRAASIENFQIEFIFFSRRLATAISKKPPFKHCGNSQIVQIVRDSAAAACCYCARRTKETLYQHPHSNRQLSVWNKSGTQCLSFNEWNEVNAEEREREGDLTTKGGAIQPPTKCDEIVIRWILGSRS